MQLGKARSDSRNTVAPLPGGLRPGGLRGGELSAGGTRTEPPPPPSLPPPPPPAAPPPPLPPPSPRASAIVLVAQRPGKVTTPSARTRPIFTSAKGFMIASPLKGRRRHRESDRLRPCALVAGELTKVHWARTRLVWRGRSLGTKNKRQSRR